MYRKTFPFLARALAVVGAFAAVALSQPGVAGAASRGFKIYNYSSYKLKLDRVKAWDDTGNTCAGFCWEGRPVDGAELAPGTPPHDWELRYHYLDHYSAELTYRMLGVAADGRTYFAGFLGVHLDVFSYENDSRCTIEAGIPAVCKAEGLTITILDPPGAVHDIPSGQADAQFQTLNDLCNSSNTAVCTFVPTKREPHLRAPARVVGNAVTNCLPTHQESEKTFEDTYIQENSVEVAVGAKFETDFVVGKAEASTELKYGHKWTTEHKFSEDEKLEIEPGWVAWVTSEAPIIRDTGDYTLKLGNTTWTLRGVYFDSPDPTGTGGFTKDGRELTKAEYAAACPHKPPPNALVSVPKSLVSLTRTGSAQRNLLIGGPESDTIYGLAGNDIIRSGAGNDKLYGGRGNDILNGGPGRDTLDGGPGADTIVDTRGPTLVRTGTRTGRGWDRVYVRDGRGDDTVICGSRRTIVTVDPTDRVIGRCGKVIRLRLR